MAGIDLKQLVSRLNEPCRRALEAAAGLTLSRTHYNVEIEHWLATLADRPDGDVAAILRHYEIEPGRFAADLNRALEKMKTGNGRAPSLAPEIVELVKQAWLLASLEHGQSAVRSGHLLWALVADETLARHARDASSQLLKIQPELLKRDFAGITANSAEAAAEAADRAESGGTAVDSGGVPRAGSGALALHTTDLTAQARAGKIDPILGRDTEIRQIIDILTRRRQNNPILTGEAGVGKTAVVEGFALRLAAGDVPPALKGVTIRSLDLGLL
jgi:type VI secretion system protein VasG